MKNIIELVGGLVIMLGGLSALGLHGVQGLQGLQATQATRVPVQTLQSGQAVQANVQSKQVEEKKRIEELKGEQEYYDYKEEGEKELWEKMKAHYKDVYYVRGGGIDEQSN